MACDKIFLACDNPSWHVIILPVGRLSWQCPSILRVMVRSVEVIWEGGNGRMVEMVFVVFMGKVYSKV